LVPNVPGRGADRKGLDVDAVDLATTAAPDQLLALDEALSKLARQGPAAAQLVELRYFAGLTVEGPGKALGMSTATAYRHWKYARLASWRAARDHRALSPNFFFTSSRPS
jgi:hypothetical protein